MAFPNGYYELTVIVEGAIDQIEMFGTSDAQRRKMQAFIDGIEKFAKSHTSMATEVYVLFHGHASDMDECVCAQYVTDGRADYVWNMA